MSSEPFGYEEGGKPSGPGFKSRPRHFIREVGELIKFFFLHFNRSKLLNKQLNKTLKLLERIKKRFVLYVERLLWT